MLSAAPADFTVPKPSKGWIPGLVTAVLAAALGYLVSLSPAWLHLGFDPATPTAWIGVLLAASVGGVIMKWPETGVLALIAIIYTNASELGVRFHYLPSALQFAAPLLMIGLTARQLIAGHWKLVWDPLMIWLLLFGVLLFASSIHASNPALADESLFEYAKSIFLVFVIGNLVSSRASLRHAVWMMVLVGAFLGTISVYQVYTSSYHDDFGGFGRVKFASIVGTVFKPRVAGPLSDPNFYAQILVVLVPVALFRAWDEPSPRLKALAAYALLVITLAIVFTYSRGGALAWALVLALSAIYKRVNLKLILFGFVILLPVLFVAPKLFRGRFQTLEQLMPGGRGVTMHLDSSFELRLLYMRAAWEMFEDFPVFGVGAGNYTEHYEDYAERVGATVSSYGHFGKRRFPHSLYLQIASELGVVGVALFGAIVGSTLLAFRSGYLGFRKAGDLVSASLLASLAFGFCGYLTTSLILHDHYMRYFWLIVALAVAGKHIARQQGEEVPRA